MTQAPLNPHQVIPGVTVAAVDASGRVVGDGSILNTTSAATPLPRSLAARGADTLNARDFGAVGDGTKHTAGQVLGITGLAGLAGYTTASGAKPYAFVSSYPFGTLFNRGLAQKELAGSTILHFATTTTVGQQYDASTSGPASPILAIEPYTSVVYGQSVSGTNIPAGTSNPYGTAMTAAGIPGGTTATASATTNVLNLSAPLTALVPAGSQLTLNVSNIVGSRCIWVVANDPVLYALSTGQTLQIGGANYVFSNYFGNIFYLQPGQTPPSSIAVGTSLFSISFDVYVTDTTGLSQGMQVTGANIAPGTELDFVNHAVREIRLSFASVAQVAAGTLLTCGWDLTQVQVGMQVSGSGIAPGTVVQAVDTTARTVTLSKPTIADMQVATSFLAATPSQYGSSITFYAPYTDAQAVALSMDSLAINAAIQAAMASTDLLGYGHIDIPYGCFQIDQCLIMPIAGQFSQTHPNIVLQGAGRTQTILAASADLGRDQFVVSSGDPTGDNTNMRGFYTGGGQFCTSELHDLSVTITGFTTALGARPKLAGKPIAMGGVKQGPRLHMHRVSVSGFNYGIWFQGDHTLYYDTTTGSNFVGYYLGPALQNLYGDHHHYNTSASNNAFANILVAPDTCLSGIFDKPYIASAPYNIAGEPSIPHSDMIQGSTFTNANMEWIGIATIKDLGMLPIGLSQLGNGTRNISNTVFEAPWFVTDFQNNAMPGNNSFTARGELRPEPWRPSAVRWRSLRHPAGVQRGRCANHRWPGR